MTLPVCFLIKHQLRTVELTGGAFDVLKVLLFPEEQAPRNRQPMKIIGAGYGRTGSESLKLALSQIGYQSHHMQDVFHNNDVELVSRVKLDDLASINLLLDTVATEGYNATTDFPLCMFYKELLARNPTAKVILSIRDSPEAWAKSYCDTIGRINLITSRPPWSWIPVINALGGVMQLVSEYTGITQNADGSPNFKSAVASYSRHIDEVKAHVPPAQLLVHNSKEGWPPLCTFLGLNEVDCPLEPYPRVNDSKIMTQRLAMFTFIADYLLLFIIALIHMTLYFIRWCRSSTIKSTIDKPKPD